MAQKSLGVPQLAIRVHSAGGWHTHKTYSHLKVRILEKRGNTERQLAMTKGESPNNEEFTFDWDTTSSLVLEVVVQGRLWGEIEPLWRVAGGPQFIVL